MSLTTRLFCLTLAALLPCTAAQAAFTFRRIAHTSQAIPGGNGNFTSFDPEIAGVNFTEAIAFRGFGAGGQEGIYTGNGVQITRLADRSTAVPGITGTFDVFGSPAGAESVVVQARGGGRTGIYRITTGGGMQVLDDAPLGSATFGRAAASLSNLVAYRRDNVIISNRTGTLAPVTFSVPNAIIQGFGDPDIALQGGIGGTSLAVRVNFLQAGQPQSGVLAKGLGATDEILYPTPQRDTREASVNWSGVVAVNEGDAAVRFRPFFQVDQQVLVGQPIPGGTGGFTGFRGVSAGSPNLGLSDTQVLFVGLGGGGQEGIYAVGRGLFGGGEPAGSPPVTKVIARGDVLDGRIVEGVSLGRDSEIGVSVAFLATFTDGSSGIYFTVLPEPSVASPIALIVLVFSCRRYRCTACIACSL